MAKTRGATCDTGCSEPAPEVSRDDIARLAYELYLRRGQVNGRELEDWIKAEAILKDRRGGAA